MIKNWAKVKFHWEFGKHPKLKYQLQLMFDWLTGAFNQLKCYLQPKICIPTNYVLANKQRLQRDLLLYKLLKGWMKWSTHILILWSLPDGVVKWGGGEGRRWAGGIQKRCEICATETNNILFSFKGKIPISMWTCGSYLVHTQTREICPLWLSPMTFSHTHYRMQH